MLMFVRLSVCSMRVCLELSIFILKQSQVSPRSISGLSELTSSVIRRLKYFVLFVTLTLCFSQYLYEEI